VPPHEFDIKTEGPNHDLTGVPFKESVIIVSLLLVCLQRDRRWDLPDRGLDALGYTQSSDSLKWRLVYSEDHAAADVFAKE
jgi:hypothetical protein